MSTEKPTAEDYARDLGRHLSPFGVSQPTRKYWAGVMLGWASEVLQPPQLEECAKVLEGIEDGYAAMRRAIEAEEAILEWYRQPFLPEHDVNERLEALAERILAARNGGETT